LLQRNRASNLLTCSPIDFYTPASIINRTLSYSGNLQQHSMATFQNLPNEVLGQISTAIGRNDDRTASIRSFTVTRQYYAVSYSSVSTNA